MLRLWGIRQPSFRPKPGWRGQDFRIYLRVCDEGPLGEGMEQKVGFIVQITDAEIERNVVIDFVVNLEIDDEEIIESSIHVRDDVGVVQGQILLAAIAGGQR
jgi:hypothetical protein